MKAFCLRAVLIFTFLLFPVFAVHADELYVDDDNIAGPWDGSLANPYQLVQDAVNAAQIGDTVLVLPGIYYENIDFMGKDITVRSDLDGDPLTADISSVAVVLDGNQTGSVVTFASTEGPGSVLEGFTIKNGSGTLVGLDTHGGGIYCSGSSPTIRYNVITENEDTVDLTLRGGGICCISASPSITENTISYNVAVFDGGGICCYTASSPTIQDNVIAWNQVDDDGAGISCASDSNPLIVGNFIVGNYSTESYAAGFPHLGGGLLCTDSSPNVNINTVTENNNGNGAGFCCTGLSAPSVDGNFFTRNGATEAGGGIHCVDGGNANVTNNTVSWNVAAKGGGIGCDNTLASFTGNDIVYNTAVSGGAIYCANDDNASFSQNIVTDNEAADGGAVYCEQEVSPNGPLFDENTFADNTASNNGGAFYLNLSAARIENNTLTGHSAIDGGVFYCDDCEAVIDGNTIDLNAATGNGGAFYSVNDVSPGYTTLRNNTITNNTAEGGGAGYILMSECLVEMNLVTGHTAEKGGAFYCDSANATLLGNTIHGNTADIDGGAVYCDSSPAIIVNCLMYENAATAGWGGAVNCDMGTNAVLTNNTITNNSASQGGGALFCDGLSSPTVTNCILWDNVAPLGPEIFLDSGANPAVHYSNVKAGWGGIGNINISPEFVDPVNNKYHLRLGSPCVDKGTNTAPGIPAADFEGDNRIVDGDFPQNAEDIADIGADELLVEIAARFGNVNSASDSLSSILLVNLSEGDNKRVYEAALGESLALSMNAPPAGPASAQFTTYLLTAEPDINDVAEQPFDIGVSCMPMPLSKASVVPPPFTLVNNIGFFNGLGTPVLTGIAPAPSVIIQTQFPAGVYTFQGYIFDQGGTGPGLSLTNAIVLKIQ